MESLLFTPASIGPVTLRNRTIRSAAFEGMGKDNNPTPGLRPTTRVWREAAWV